MTMVAMTLDRLDQLLDAYGARAERWPDAEREAALALLAASAAARARRDAAATLDAVLDRTPAAAPSRDLAHRILAGAPRPRVVALRRRPRAPVIAAIGLAAASLALWLVRRPATPRTLEPAALAQLEVYDTPSDALLAATELDNVDTLPVFGCDDPEVDCDEANVPAGRPSAARPRGLEEILA
jgi:hypothetical protein